MMKYLQKLGKSLMLPVACLPICGILMGIGYALCPATMQGGDIAGFLPKLGFFLVKAGGGINRQYGDSFRYRCRRWYVR